MIGTEYQSIRLSGYQDIGLLGVRITLGVVRVIDEK